jgi:kinetochore protein Spc7/SPC105
MLRRPSGYFAKRKSMGMGLPDGRNAEVRDANAGTGRSSPKKKAGLGLGRASIGSGPQDIWTRSNRDAEPSVRDTSKSNALERDQEKEARVCNREAGRQAIAAPSPTRGSPAPTSPRLSSPAVLSIDASRTDTSLRSPAVSAGDLSAMLVGAFGEPEMEMETGVGKEMHMDATKQWREGVQQEEYPDDEEVGVFAPPFPCTNLSLGLQPIISIEQFFGMTGIRFMDELTAPRRSTHPSQQSSRQPRATAEIPLTEFATAMAIDIPQLVLYSRVSKDLEAWIEKSKVVYTQAEEEAAKITPELFIEYSRADEEGQAELLVS